MSSTLDINRVWSRLKFGLVALPVILACLVSPSALIAFGVDYVVPGGNPIAKVHPATYLACAAIIVFAASGSIQKIMDTLFRGSSPLFYYFAALIVLFAYAAAVLSVPFMPLIDTLLHAGLVPILISLLSLSDKWLLARSIDVFIFANSALGMIETVRNWRLIPLTQWSALLGQYVYPIEWRATAFLGHPLANSYVVGVYVLSLLLTKRIPNLYIKVPLMGFHLLAMCAFGSRAALVFLVIGFALYIGIALFRSFFTGRIPKDVLLFVMGIVPIVFIIIPIVLLSGFADRYVERFSNDHGSAEARNIVFQILQDIEVKDLIFGTPTTLLAATLQRYDVIAIESFWVNFLFTFGIVGCVIFFPAIYRLCQFVVRKSSKASAILLLYFFVCCSTSVSISSKSLILSITIAICMTSLDFKPLWARRKSEGAFVDYLPRADSPVPAVSSDELDNAASSIT